MPSAKSKKSQPAVVELLPPDENDQIKTREVKHTAQWIEQRPVEEVSDDDGADLEDAEIEDRPRKKTKNAIQEMRKKLRAQGVTPSSNLRLYIERYIHSETDAGGSWAETEFCTKYGTTEEHVLDKGYIDAARKWGAGKYRITIRMDNRIVDAFDERISATPIIQHINPNDPNSPQVIIQSDGQQAYQPMSMKDMMKGQKESLKEELEFRRLLMESYGITPNQSASQQQPRSEEEIIAGAIIKQPAVLETVIRNLVKQAGGKSEGGDEPWYAGLLKDSITTGQLAQTAQAIINGLFPNGLFGGLNNLFPERQQNGQAEMAQAPIQNQTQPGADQQHSQLVSGEEVGQEATPVHASGSVAGDVHRGSNAQTPEEQTLAIVLNNCSRKVPPQITADQVLKYADLLNDQAPQYSIDGYLEMFAKMPTEAALEFVKTQPNGEQIANLEWAKDYTEQLQKLIRASLQEGEE